MPTGGIISTVSYFNLDLIPTSSLRKGTILILTNEKSEAQRD